MDSLHIAQDEKWISYNNPDHPLEWCDVDQDPESVARRSTHYKKDMPCFFFCSERSVYWEILEKVKLSIPLSSVSNCRRLRPEFHQLHTAGQTPAADGKREMPSCENHLARAEGSRDGVTTPSILFPRRFSMRFTCISKPGKLLRTLP